MAENILYSTVLGWTLGWPEILLILVLALLILGGKKLPEFMRSLGKSLTEFRKGVREAEQTKDEIADEAKDAAGLDDTKKEE